MAATEHQQKDDDDGQEPAHHARRPMNAFLIFCKRHRASVRSGFPHLENRAVTRVLGEWWAMLNDEQKQAYTNLAQEYKDAFLNANPDFKWYKLPAPPLRTLSTRPTNKKIDFSQSESAGESTKLEYLTKLEEDLIQPGKLADESQLGSLSSLFTPQKVSPQNFSAAASNILSDDNKDNSECPKPPKKRYIGDANSPSSKEDCKANLFGNEKNLSESNNNNSHLSASAKEDSNKTEILIENNQVEENNFREARTCKSPPYQKFLDVQVAALPPKPRQVPSVSNSEQLSRERRNSISSNVSEKTDSLSSEGTSSRGDLEFLVESADGNLEPSKPEDTETEGHSTWMSRKRFKAEDFNLDKKIEALPSLSLEEFQAMKKQQRTKKKKILYKLNSKKHGESSTEIMSGVSHLIGSQKRKAPKQNITRKTANVLEDTDKACYVSPGLEALACLAAVAANRTKLTKS